MKYKTLIKVAANLVSEEGSNPEYDRAIYEFIVDLAGVGEGMDDGRAIVAEDIAAYRRVELRLNREGESL